MAKRNRFNNQSNAADQEFKFNTQFRFNQIKNRIESSDPVALA